MSGNEVLSRFPRRHGTVETRKSKAGHVQHRLLQLWRLGRHHRSRQLQGTGPTSILYQDFQALKAAIPALDAIDFDDENSFNSPTTIQFGVMLANWAIAVMPDAFDDSSYWTNVVSQINITFPAPRMAFTCKPTLVAAEITRA